MIQVVVLHVQRRLRLYDHLWILWWLCKLSLGGQSLEQVGHWNSIIVMSAEDALWCRS